MNVFQQEIQLQFTHCDLAGTWRPSAILETMQDMAGIHGTELGFGREAMLKQNLVWVVTRLEVEMDRYPRYGETVHVETFPTINRRCFFPRWFLFKDADGHEIGRAGSLWALLDLSARRMAPPTAVTPLLPDNSGLTPPMSLPATCFQVGKVQVEGLYVPQYADLDVNMHVNNVRYMDLCCNALGIDAMRENWMHRFAINYDKEIVAGQQIKTLLGRDGESFSFSGVEGDQRHFDISGILLPR